MSRKGDLLELIDQAPVGLQTVEARLWRWTHNARTRQAIERIAQQRGGSVGFATFGTPEETSDEHLHVLLQPPSRWRIQSERLLDVSDGERRWLGGRDRVTEHEAGQLDLDLTEVGILFAPGAHLFGILRFDDPTEDEVGGRRAWKVTASLAPACGRRGPVHLGMRLGGIDHTFWFDAVTGVVLRHMGEIDGSPCCVSEFSAITLNQPISSAVFTLDESTDLTVEKRIDTLIRAAERRGVDLSSVDTSDEGAVQVALNAALGPHRPTSEEMQRQRRAKHVPSGPPPADEAAARAGIEYAYTHHNEVDDDGVTLVNVQAGTNLAEPLRQAAKRIPDPNAASANVVVDDVLFLRPDEAVVWFGVEVGGQRFAGVNGWEGRAVLIEGRWLIEHATIVGLLGFAGVNAPPPPSSS